MNTIQDFRRSYECYQPDNTDKNIPRAWEYVYSPKDQNKISYGDIKVDSKGKFLEVPYTGYSDYSGSTVERSNCNCFLDTFEEYLGISMWEMYGGYGTRGVLITLELYENNDEVKDIIDSLFDYPLINEDEMSSLEMEIENESWDDWIKSDLIRLLDKNNLSYNEDTLQADFYKVCENANEYPIFEDAVSCWINLDKIVENWNIENEDNNE